MKYLFPFDNTYARLPDRFYARTDPVPVEAPRLLVFNTGLARTLHMDSQAVAAPASLAAVFSGNRLPAGTEALAQAYAGHQFGSFVPQLGDGRAHLLGEVIDAQGRRRDIQLKGSGITPFSRGGDGRAALGPVLREYLVSEAMHALGIPGTRALAAVATGQPVYREQPLPGAVFTRVAASHVRVGTFEFFAARGDREALRLLLDYVIARHYPVAAEADSSAVALLEAVAEAQASLVARWLGVGFIHGVMNTDNTAISGETIDFGPCAFMDNYDPGTVFSSIDRRGRYAYANQPRIAQWNLARLAETLLPLADPDQARAVDMLEPVVHGFTARFERHWLAMMRAKLGLAASAEPGDAALAQGLLDAMQADGLDFTLTFRRLASLAEPAGAGAALTAWLPRWRHRLANDPQSPNQRAEAMRAVNPAVIPRNHRVEEALAAAVESEDLGPFERLLDVLQRPFDPAAEDSPYALAPASPDPTYRTFCGT